MAALRGGVCRGLVADQQGVCPAAGDARDGLGQQRGARFVVERGERTDEAAGGNLGVPQRGQRGHAVSERAGGWGVAGLVGGDDLGVNSRNGKYHPLSFEALTDTVIPDQSLYPVSPIKSC